MGWFSTGWDDLDEKAEEKPWDDSKSKGPQRTWMPPQQTQRHIFVDDIPTRFWEHGFKWNGSWKGNHEPCVTKNKIGAECPICDSGDKMFPSFIGLLTSINMTPWFTKKGNREVNLRREIFAAKLGTKKKPGVLKKLERIRKEHGRIIGLVFDIHRTGDNSAGCGDDFTLVEKVDPKEIEAYGRAQLAEYAARLNDGIPEDKQISVEKLWERNPWEGYNFEEMIKPREMSELRSMFKRGTQSGEYKKDSSGGGGGSSGGGSSGGGSSGGDSDPNDFSDEDDIPY